MYLIKLKETKNGWLIKTSIYDCPWEMKTEDVATSLSEAIEIIKEERVVGNEPPKKDLMKVAMEIKDVVYDPDHPYTWPKIKCIKAVRNITGCGLKEAKEAMEEAFS